MAPKASTKATEVDEFKELDFQAPDPRINEESHQFEESVNDMVDELLEEHGQTVPELSVLLADAEAIEKALAGKSQPNVPHKKHKGAQIEKVSNSKGKGKEITPDLDATPTTPRKPFIHNEHSEISVSDPIDEDYQESFASQMETAEMRGEIESFSVRLTNMESIIEGLLKERTNLPVHLERLNVSINQQFTVMNERLNAAIESNMVGSTLTQTSQDASVLAKSASNIIDTIQTDLNLPPTTSSQISQGQVIVGGRKKVRVIR
jgi:uncharacterized protein (UPF0147 family)